MRNNLHLFATVVALVTFAFVGVGCEREIGSVKETDVKDDGTVRTKEKTVSEDADGDTIIRETEETKKPDNPG